MPRRRPTPDSTKAGGGEGGSSRWSPQDMLVPYVLLAVSMQRAHGYLIEHYLTNHLKFTGPDTSTLYRTLRQLEKDGLLLSAWEPGPTGPARRVYSITEAGRAWLDTWVSMLDSYRGMIDNFFSFYTGGLLRDRDRDGKNRPNSAGLGSGHALIGPPAPAHPDREGDDGGDRAAPGTPPAHPREAAPALPEATAEILETVDAVRTGMRAGDRS